MVYRDRKWVDRIPEVVLSDCKWSLEYRKWSNVTGSGRIEYRKRFDVTGGGLSYRKWVDRIPEVVLRDCVWSLEYRKWSDRVPEKVRRDRKWSVVTNFSTAAFVDHCTRSACWSTKVVLKVGSCGFCLSVRPSVRLRLFSETTGPIAMKFGRNHLDWHSPGGFFSFFRYRPRLPSDGLKTAFSPKIYLLLQFFELSNGFAFFRIYERIRKISRAIFLKFDLLMELWRNLS